ncbi:IMV-cell attachment, fusion, and microtubule transport [Squirrelpox virus]|uniref:IMV-cell attachment, fusion, and microtubule transport n=1 Tax=Squirrelpox virus TaxID=240426 RepID=Q1HTR9_9POXV|nr:IMV-cell attachment, fusion, and microtubule transport [Squirrelpox virus]ABD51467.1 O2L [Squirrelpox virus]CCD83299.1 IMV-cell attachment, fusion, and microtubule transport [Squirrelpox virus]
MENEEPMLLRVTDRNRERLKRLLEEQERVIECCEHADDRLTRLEKHADTLRETMLKLARKIDVQTGRRPGYYFE